MNVRNTPINYSGALYTDSVTTSYGGSTMSNANAINYVALDASRSSSLYTNDTDTLNPDSLTCKFAIKY